jgi:DNA polymerase-4
MRRYRESAARLRTTLRRVIERLEPAGLGAAYLDASGLAPSPDELALDLCKRVGEELGLPLRVGISGVRFLARLAAEDVADDALPPVGRVPAGREARYLASLPVGRLPGVGPATAARLAELGASTIGELAGLERSAVEAALGAHGRTIWEYAHGRDAQRVRPAAHPKSLSQESSFSPEELDSTAIVARLQGLAEGLAASLAREELRARRVTLKLRYADQERASRSCTLDAPIASAAEIHARAAALLERTQAGSRAVRGVGIVLGGLSPERREDRQLDLFGGRS